MFIFKEISAESVEPVRDVFLRPQTIEIDLSLTSNTTI